MLLFLLAQLNISSEGYDFGEMVSTKKPYKH
ncbi:hypothetical protein CECT5772_04456 [Streptococcus equi subsp. ruminatorum CECT 5772]|uniref:Uncharacterized protein n=1 Tax=Streptococcus equi subsp. ruminatorum CECT 5772 TaxID=1051981 RepID=A0A922NUH2_9STRE|nr:hypothetical protein CECT5772_04456 [Streptococcus equi subsp. ruminatorum CECT 5772]